MSNNAIQYHMFELQITGKKPAGSEAMAAPRSIFTHASGEQIEIRGFYRGNGLYSVRFLPEKTGCWNYRIVGEVCEEGSIMVQPAEAGQHGPVRANGLHLFYADGKPFTAFGTTVYGLANQENALVEQTLDTLRSSPFNKVRLCVFPKHYDYNHNEPPFFPFEKGEECHWDVNRPCYAFWDRFEKYLETLADMGIEADLILFHPYDRWGFESLPQSDNLVYLDYLLRRLAALPNIWWSLANEYDLCMDKTETDWCELEAYIAEHDPYHHLLSNHNCFAPWDASRKNITHMSWQTKQLNRIPEMMKKYRKPVMVDECCYEGNVQHFWGNISGQEMTQRFWRAITLGGGCTHGETFLNMDKLRDPDPEKARAYGEDAVLWWAKGGRLIGESPVRIAFLREIIESLPGHLEEAKEGISMLYGVPDEDMKRFVDNPEVPESARPLFRAMARLKQPERDRFMSAEYTYAGHVDDRVFLWYKDTQCCAFQDILLPDAHKYTVEVIDTWKMTRETYAEHFSGPLRVFLPGKPYMAILATAE